MMERRKLVACAAGFAFVLGSPRIAEAIPMTPDRLAFEVIRKGSVIGLHVLNFERNREDLLVRTDVRIRAGLGPITLFRYHHQAIERWQGAHFVGIETTTDNNGEPLRLSAKRVGDTVEVDSKLGRQTLPGNALPLTHWNIQCWSGPVFNPQDGTVLDGPVTGRGTETVLLGDGTKVQARRFSMGGEAPLDDWYDDTQTWVHLRATAKDGSLIEYRRTG